MPSKAAQICSEPGCAEIAVSGSSRCAAHQRPRWPTGADTRPSAARRGYGYQWSKLRAAFLSKNPACEFCGAPATDVDHIVPKRWGGTNDESNLQALCHSCHSRKTARGR